jgi:hypothetical protein
MSMANESELLVEPPRYLGLTPKGGNMGKRQSNRSQDRDGGIALLVQGHDLSGRQGQVEIVGPSRRRLQANRECLTSCDNDSSINTGRPISCPQGIGWHEA